MSAEWPPDWSPEMIELYCEEHDTIHACGEFAIGDDPHGEKERLISCGMDGACVMCRHARRHFRIRDEEALATAFPSVRARCACRWAGPWRPLDKDPFMDAIWHCIIWRSKDTDRETGMAILAYSSDLREMV